MRERLGLSRVWSMDLPADAQTYEQNDADERFDWWCEQAKALGIAVAPIRRTMRFPVDEDGTRRMVFYWLRTDMEGTEEKIQMLKDIIDGKRPALSLKQPELLSGEDARNFLASRGW